MSGWVVLATFFGMLCIFWVFVIRDEKRSALADKPSWCQGCNEIRPTKVMAYDTIGMYRCDVCRKPESKPEAKKPDWVEQLARTGSTVDHVIPLTDRQKMQALARGCFNCHERAAFMKYDHFWCEFCLSEHERRKQANAFYDVQPGAVMIAPPDEPCKMLRTYAQRDENGCYVKTRCMVKGPHDIHLYPAPPPEPMEAYQSLINGDVAKQLQYRVGAQF